MFLDFMIRSKTQTAFDKNVFTLEEKKSYSIGIMDKNLLLPIHYATARVQGYGKQICNADVNFCVAQM